LPLNVDLRTTARGDSTSSPYEEAASQATRKGPRGLGVNFSSTGAEVAS
jgi:hypothetical protein